MKFRSRRIATYLFLWTILIALVSSCSFKVERLDQPIATILPSATLPVITATPAPPPTLESVFTPTPQATAELSLEQECIPVEERMPDDLNLSGVWVRNRGKPYLEPMDGSTAYGVPLKGGSLFSTGRGDMAVSPDGRYLAYIDSHLDETGKKTQSRVLRVINSSGRSLSMDYWVTNWQWLVGWLDNQHIAILTGNKELLLLEPFTGEWKELQQPSWLGNVDYHRYGYEGPFYSPSLNNIFIQSGTVFELRDFQTGKTLYQGDGYPDPRDLDWSADGSTLAIGVKEFLHVVTRNQQVIEVDASKLGINSVNYPKLSPDGQKLVFTSYWSGKLFLFDIKPWKIQKVCSDEFNYWGNAVWSPDGRFVVQEVDRSRSDPFDLLIDTQQMRAYKLTSGRYQHRLVWLAEP